jgi:gluconokinase
MLNENAGSGPSVLVVMGVSGCGKSTIVGLLGEALGWQTADADQFHPPANIEKMSRKIPLTDEDRWPWLHAIAAWIDELRGSGRRGIVSCSALKRRYRTILIGDRTDVRLIFLKGAEELIASRLAKRKDHFMPPALLHSQFQALEEPGPEENPITVGIEPTPPEIAQQILAKLKLAAR